jgi:uncharacterized protein YdaU (DUF1376 family)
MNTPRLDWMKFNIYDFAHSEDVQMMTDAEVGQYVLLLVAAWTGGKDCTLPNNPKFLERTARNPVSPVVMARFKEIDGRLVNEAQLEVWNEGQEKSAAFSERGKKARAKQLQTVVRDDPATSQQDAGSLPTEVNRCDVMRNEKISTCNVAAASAVASLNHSFSSSNTNSTASSTASKPVHDSDFDMDFGLSSAEELAHVCQDPVENNVGKNPANRVELVHRKGLRRW